MKDLDKNWRENISVAMNAHVLILEINPDLNVTKSQETLAILFATKQLVYQTENVAYNITYCISNYE